MKQKFLFNLIIMALLFSGCNCNKIASNSKSTLCNSNSSSSNIKNHNVSTKNISSLPINKLLPKEIIAPYDMATAKKNHDVFTYINLSSITPSWEVFNINYMNDFLNNIKQGKKDKIRIVQFSKFDNKLLVDKLIDLDFSGKYINYTEYDTVSQRDIKYTSKETIIFGKIQEIIKNEITIISLKDNLKDQGNRTPLNVIIYADSQIK